MLEIEGVEATELHGEDPREVMANAMAGELTLQAMVESEAQRTQRLLSTPYVLSLKNAAERRCSEADRIRADLSFSAYKAKHMRRDEDHRALVAQVQFGDAR